MNWNVGDKVACTVGSYGGGRLDGPRIIERVTKRKVVLDDGSEWVNSSYASKWGYGNSYNPPRLRAWDSSVERKVAEQNHRQRALELARKIERDYDTLTSEQLDAIEAALGDAA